MEVPLYFVERNNSDHRKEKLIHPFDGRAIPLDPLMMRQYARNLASKLSTDKVDYILGFSEGGLIPAFSIAEVIGLPFLGSYRARLKLDNEIHFFEEHSERPDHFIYGLKPGDTVIIIEDEVTTGATLLNAIVQLELNNIKINDIGVYVLNCTDDVLKSLCERGRQVKFLYSKVSIF